MELRLTRLQTYHPLNGRDLTRSKPMQSIKGRLITLYAVTVLDRLKLSGFQIRDEFLQPKGLQGMRERLA
jgi:hypothetical protein